jgi:hypothetical protein
VFLGLDNAGLRVPDVHDCADRQTGLGGRYHELEGDHVEARTAPRALPHIEGSHSTDGATTVRTQIAHRSSVDLQVDDRCAEARPEYVVPFLVVLDTALMASAVTTSPSSLTSASCAVVVAVVEVALSVLLAVVVHAPVLSSARGRP